MQIIALDLAGQPFRRLAPEEAVTYHALSKAAWTVGDPVQLFRARVCRDGQRSLIASPPIIAVAGSEAMSRVLREAIPPGDRNDLLFRRNRHLCAYCGGEFACGELTRDHVLAQSRGGQDKWTNVVSACRRCNERKAARTPEEARMSIRYLPYAPCRYEHFILSGRAILADRMDYLAAKLPRHSRWLS